MVRDLFRTFAARHRTDSADVARDARAAAQAALVDLGLGELRRWSPPAATVQECALLAEEHGGQPLCTSLLGTVLLAPELLRLLGADAGQGGSEASGTGTPTVALAADLGFVDVYPTPLVAWDTEGADSALHVAPDGTVSRLGLGEPAPTVDLLRGVRTVVSDGEPHVVGHLDTDQMRHWQAYALVITSGELVGAASAFLGMAVDYARDRRQYGRAIGGFQAVQHLLADATVLVEACTSATRYAAWCLDHESPATALTAARVAKVEVNSSALEAIHTGMQVFGGIAQTWEHTAHLYLRKALVGATTMATSADLLVALAAEPEAVR